MSVSSVPRVRTAELGLWRFNREHYYAKRPIVVEDAATSWPAYARWNATYLKRTIGARKVGILRSERGLFDYNVAGVIKKMEVPFDEALDLMSTEKGCQYYLQQRSLRHEFPELLPDLGKLTQLDPTKRLGMSLNLWIGGSGCRTPLHYDHYDNFIVQIAGRKELMLFPPQQADNLYPAVGMNLPHCSQVDVFSPDEERFPRYREALGQRLSVTLQPGNVLYLPRRWWHAVESHELAVMVNYWWLDLRQLLGAGKHRFLRLIKRKTQARRQK